MKLLNDLVLKRVCIVMPTYNEEENIEKMLEKLIRVFSDIKDYEMVLLVVDGYSPDGTGEIVERYAKRFESIHMLCMKKEGLGKAYISGIRYAIDELHCDYILEMDADFSHNPDDLPRLLRSVRNGNNFVIGSRYIQGGTIPPDWGIARKLNSRVANLVARFIADLEPIRDCTSGYRCVSAKLIKDIGIEDMRSSGYAFQMELLSLALDHGARVEEIPIDFIDRTYGRSKIRIRDRTEFISSAIKLRMEKSRKKVLNAIFLLFLLSLAATVVFGILSQGIAAFLINFYLFISILMIVQGAANLYMTLYIWERPELVERNTVPRKFTRPKRSFSVLLPARNEETVIARTIESIHTMDYPKTLMEIIVICEKSDSGTIEEVRRAMDQARDGTIRLVIFDDKPINKPHALNKGLAAARNEIVTIYDAEDEVNPGIFNAINTVLSEDDSVGVIQSGVQLMNYASHWFSVHNVLEYYFWFKSRLHFHADIGMIPLGGNSVFFRRQHLLEIGGWDENCLTEDADIGVRLSAEGIKMKVLYDERYATREETPADIGSFIRQRTRWVQGFLQVFLKFEWTRYHTPLQKAMAAYILLISFLQALMVILLPLSFFVMIRFDLGVLASMILILPMYLLLMQLAINFLGMIEFVKLYRLKMKGVALINLMVTFFPYQCVLGFSAIRGLIRELGHKNDWEKTPHHGLHRNLSPSMDKMFKKEYETASAKIYRKVS